MNTSETRYPKVAVCSLFRNSASVVSQYFRRLEGLTYPKDALAIVCVEGDSRDNTWELLQKERVNRQNVIVKKLISNMPAIWGCAHPARIESLARSANLAIRTAVREINADYILWLESDLECPHDLIESLMQWNKDIISPMVVIKGTNRFYDTWAFRAGDDTQLRGPEGALGCFQPEYPYHPVYDPEGPFRIDCAGSALLVRADIVREGAHFTDDEAIVGLCKTATALGYDVWADPKTVVSHPVPKHGGLVGKIRHYPWHEAKVMSKLQEKVPIDKSAYKIGKRLKYGRPLEYGWIAKRLYSHPEARTLDFGCGDSEFPSYLAAQGIEVVAVDKRDLSETHKKYQEKLNVAYTFTRQDGLCLEFPDNHFDQVLAVSSVEHERNDIQLMKELSRVCKPNGKILISVPYDHFSFWWDADRPDGGQYYYNIQSVFERLVLPIKAAVKDFSFIHYSMPFTFEKPFFTHPSNGGVIVVEMEIGHDTAE